jgi:predicted DNA-binding helix-hairpin-helix protein
VDPKLAWAMRHRESFPVDVNRAPREMLLRVPGIGVRSVQRIVAVRRWRRIRLHDLGRLKVPLTRVLPFVITADYNPHLLRLDSIDLLDRVAPHTKDARLLAAIDRPHDPFAPAAHIPRDQLELFTDAALAAVSGEF